MTQEEKRIKIAEHLGWKGPFRWGNAPTYEGGEDQGLVGIDPDGDVQIVPNYFRDLNDCHAMEVAMDDEYTSQWMDALSMVVHSCEGLATANMMQAKAAQRAEAYGICFGLWKEGE